METPERVCGVCGMPCQAPGKFQGTKCQTVARALYDMTLESATSAEVETLEGWYALILHGVPNVPDAAAYIVQEDAFGFFDYTPYASVAAARAEWDTWTAAAERAEDAR